MRSQFYGAMMNSIPPINPVFTGCTNFWNFDNSAVDLVGSANGTLINAPSYVSGKVNQDLDYNGVDQYISLPTGTFNKTGDWAFSCWFKPDNVTTLQCLLSSVVVFGGNQYGIRILMWDDGKIHVTIGDGTGVPLDHVCSTALTAGVYNHIVIDWEIGNMCRFYIDNTFINDRPVGGVIAYTTTHYPAIAVEHYEVSSRLFYIGGQIDSMGLWDRVLTSTDRDTLWNSGNGFQF